MTADRAKPAPRLVPEYRLVMTLSNAVVASRIHVDLAEVEDAALRLARSDTKATWVIERRWVSEWSTVPTPVGVLFDTDGVRLES